MLISDGKGPRRAHFALWTPLALVLAATVFIWLTDFDRTLASRFFDPAGHWPAGGVFPWDYTNRYGEAPGFITGMLGLIVLAVGWRVLQFQAWRKTAAFLFLLLALGPGLLVNGIFKELYGRPRPLSVQEFGGPYPFLHVWEPGFGIDDVEGAPARKSFPSGHAANGFYFVAAYFIFKRERPRMAVVALWFGIALGFFIGFGRVVAGKHWASDLVWSFAMVYCTAYILARLLRMDYPPGNATGVSGNYRLAGTPRQE